MRILMFFICMFFSIVTFAQANYIFPEFVSGEVYYKESATVAAVNYNLFLSDILAIDGKKKKRLADVDRIEYVSADTKRFVPLNDNTFGEILINGGLTLAVKYSGNIVMTNENGKSITKTSLNKLLDSGSPLPEGVMITVDSTYYFVKQKNTQKMFYLPGTNVAKASHVGIIKLFAKHKTEINAFIESNKTDFSSFESLKKLIDFCEQYTD
ncbi:MAG: hypothetical protein LBS43_08590 [Prevotellaceae bacterium]|nr:hypothetical protein [Prevotellaceae bacterium]